MPDETRSSGLDASALRFGEHVNDAARESGGPFHKTMREEAEDLGTTMQRIGLGRQLTNSEMKLRKMGSSAAQSPVESVHSELQVPNFDAKRDIPLILDEYVNNYGADIKALFKQNVPLAKFRRALARETKKGNFDRGLEKTREWEALFKYRHDNKLYHHLRTLARWQEESQSQGTKLEESTPAADEIQN